MRIDSYDTDTGGSIQPIANRTITAIDRTSRGITGAGSVNTFAGSVTFSGGAAAFTAGHGIYRAGDYGGNSLNGIRGLVQNADLSTTFLGVTYASQPGLKANVLESAGAPREVTDDLMRQMADMIYHNGGEVDSIRCNTGVMNAIGGLSTSDKRYQVVKGDGPKYVLGWKDGDLLFSYDKAQAVIKKDPQIPARELYFLSLKNSFMKHTLAELDFLDGGGPNGVLHLTPASGGGFEYSWTALVYANFNVSCYYPTMNGIIRDISDAGLAGD